MTSIPMESTVSLPRSPFTILTESTQAETDGPPINPDWDELRTNEISQRLESESPMAILEWSAKSFHYPRLCSSTSFQPAGVAMMHMSVQIDPSLPIYFVDTGFHFPETLQFRDQIVQLLGINLVTLKPQMLQADFGAKYGLDLHDRDPATCCAINKVEPMQRALKNHDAWMSSIRRDGGEARKDTPIVQRMLSGVLKISPLANWRREQVMMYLLAHNLPTHPLIARGYKTIGCAPLSCTRPVAADENERAGRWVGKSMEECGLHTFDSPNAKPPASKSQAIRALDNIDQGAGI